MKDIIIKALDQAIKNLDKQTPKFKKEVKSISVIDVSPINIPDFLKENNIPEDCYLDGRGNGYDGWNDILISWEIDVPTTEDDRLRFRRKRFSNIAFQFVRDALLKAGYKRNGYNSRLLKEFKDTTVYDMYINEEFDRIVKYYSLSFKKY